MADHSLDAFDLTHVSQVVGVFRQMGNDTRNRVASPEKVEVFNLTAHTINLGTGDTPCPTISKHFPSNSHTNSSRIVGYN
ncbi:MAG: hypothetical protein WCV59_05660 [Parcubacteria group bacterium]